MGDQATRDGPIRLFRAVGQIADVRYKQNAKRAVGHQLLGTVTATDPLEIAPEGVAKLTEANITLIAEDLIIPSDMILVRGDRVVMRPAENGRLFIVDHKVRSADLTPANIQRFGVNADNTGAEFAGVEIEYSSVDGSSTVRIKGTNIIIASYDETTVTVDGVNVKTLYTDFLALQSAFAAHLIGHP